MDKDRFFRVSRVIKIGLNRRTNETRTSTEKLAVVLQSVNMHHHHAVDYLFSYKQQLANERRLKLFVFAHMLTSKSKQVFAKLSIEIVEPFTKVANSSHLANPKPPPKRHRKW